MPVTKPPVTARLTWEGALKFRAATPKAEILLDSDGVAGPSPVDATAIALAGCMAMDVADIIVKGRHPLKSLETSITGYRNDDPPRYFLRFELHFVVGGNVPAHAIQRAIDLSHEKYCSVWHSLRRDTQIATTFEVQA